MNEGFIYEFCSLCRKREFLENTERTPLIRGERGRVGEAHVILIVD